MAYYKEIVTKAVIGKGKKTTKDIKEVNTHENVNNVLGCWVINHSFQGVIDHGSIYVNGVYDVNVWYSYDNNTKTNVMIKRFDYSDLMNVRLKENTKLDNQSEIIVRTLSQPSVTDVSNNGTDITLTIEKQMGVEVVGDTKVRVSVEDDYDDYEEIIDEEKHEEIKEDIEITDDYLEDKNS